MSSDKIIRVYDKVLIKKPEFFIRCGYPMDVEEETHNIQKEFGEKILELFKCVGIQSQYSDIYLIPKDDRSFQKVCRELAYAKCKSEKFGGRERKVYTEEDDRYQGEECQVLEISFVKTGRYVPASCGGPWDYEYEPAELVSQKTHKILKVYCQKHNSNKLIEAINVEKA